MLSEYAAPLWEGHDVAMLDLDGVVYVGEHAVAGAPERLDEARAAGMHLAYVTNNASRPPAAVASHLRELGIPVEDTDVVNSAQAAARMLADQVPAGSAVYVIGGEGLFDALRDLDLVPVQSIEAEPVAVVSGYSPDLVWRTVMNGAILVRRGLPWVASNMDMSVPTERGIAPGNGVLVSAVAEFADREPQVAGKPMTPLFEETRRRVGGERPLVVGDRLDTDIEGAVASGLDSLLVMTGVTGLVELVAARPEVRPTYIGAGLEALGECHAIPTGDPGDGQHGDGRHGEPGGWRLGGWRAAVSSGRLDVTGSGSVSDFWRVVATAAWTHLDTAGEPADVSGVQVPGSVVRDQDTGRPAGAAGREQA